MIGPSSLLGPLAPLVAYHRAHGVTVKVVKLADLYARYSAGIVDPRAIQTYVSLAQQALGTRSVLLVGGDTFDYRDYSGCNPNAVLRIRQT